MKIRVSLGVFLASLLVMVKGIRNNQPTLARRGIDSFYADKIEALVIKCQFLNAEQEGLKAKLKEKTAELRAKVEKLYREAAKARGVIKLVMPYNSWREFGIEDKH